MIENQNKQYELEERTFTFAKNIRILAKTIHKSIANMEDCKQLVRSSGSVAANYIEANEALSKKDFLMRIKISRKEAKESRLWLKLLDIDNEGLDLERQQLLKEATELLMILSAIMHKSEAKNV